jgi:perosamine synthetase
MLAKKYLELVENLCNVAALYSRKELYSTVLTEDELIKVKEEIENGWFSTASSRVRDFEDAISNFTGFKYAIAVNSGSAALHSMLLASGIEKEDEVILPAASFVATPNAVLNCGAVPHFIDIDKQTLGIDVKLLKDMLENQTKIKNGKLINAKSGKRIGAILNVDFAGYPGNHFEVSNLAREWKIPYLSDSAGSLGTIQRNKHVGFFCDAAAISLNGNKVMTTGGGGFVLTNIDELALKVREISQVGRVSHPYEVTHSGFGLNYRMLGTSASLGLAQVSHLQSRLALKEALNSEYVKSIAGSQEFNIYSPLKEFNVEPNYWLNVLQIHSIEEKLLIEIIELFQAKGYMVRRSWTPLFLLPHLKKFEVTGRRNTMSIYDGTIMLPSSVNYHG